MSGWIKKKKYKKVHIDAPVISFWKSWHEYFEYKLEKYELKYFLVCFTVNQGLRNAALEDCALCQESISSSELAAKARDGDFEGTFFFSENKVRQYCCF